MRRVIAVVVVLAALGLAGCGLRDRELDPDQAQAAALVALGLPAEDVAPAGLLAGGGSTTESDDPQAVASASEGWSWGDGSRWRRFRAAFRERALHGEATVTGQDGEVRTIVAQRGTVTAIDGTSLTVTSTDGFELVWTMGDDIIVVADRQRSSVGAVSVGAEVGVAGGKLDGATVARVIIVPTA